MRPDYKRIAELEVEEYGEVLTPEAKPFSSRPSRSGLWESESETTKSARAVEMDLMLTEYGVE